MIDPIFHMFKIKHAVLDKLHVLNDEMDRVHIYINLESVFNKLINPRVNNFLVASIKTKEDKTKLILSLTSHVINLGQHYRLYCSKKGKDSRIILYWNYPVSKDYINRKYIVDYRAYYNHKMGRNQDCYFLTECIGEVFHLLEKLIPFINEVYLINGGRMESSILPSVMEQELYGDYSNHTQKVLISDSKYEFQYVNQEGFTVIESAKDKSIVINQNNVIEILKERMDIKSILTVPSTLIPFVICLLGDRYRNIPKLAGVGLATILKMANTAIQNNLITASTKDVDMLTAIITDAYKDQFRKNYLCTDIDYQRRELTPLDISNIRQQVVDKFDDRTLRKMNERYFLHCPLMLVDTKTKQVLDSYEEPRRSIWERKRS